MGYKWHASVAEYKLATDARDVYFARMAGKSRKELPDFEDYVFELCNVAGELRKTGDYHPDSTLPADPTLRGWRYTLQKFMK